MGKIQVGDIRNLALVGHGAVGKTTLVDALLFHAKAVERKGSVEDGTSVMDYDEEEKHRKSSIDAAIAHLDWHGKRFHVIDTPGYPDFMGQAISAIHNVETVLVVIDAHKGIEVNTRRMFEEANRAGVARVVILNKLDTDNIEFEELLDRVRETFGKECVLLQVPIGIGHDLKGVVRLLDMPAETPAGALLDTKELIDSMIERIVETDDELLEKFLDGEIPSHDVLAATLTRAVAAGRLVPVICASGKKEIGLTEMLNGLAEYAPSPLEGLKRTATKGQEEVSLEPVADAPFVARVFKAHADKFGNLNYMRIFQGTVKSNATAKCSRDESSHRLGQLNVAQGKNLEKVEELGPGEFLCVAKVEGVNINDTLSDSGLYTIPPVKFPVPMFPLAVNAKSRNDDAKVVTALRKVMHEDPCFELHRDEQTQEMVMSGLSQLHLEVIQHRLKSRDHLELATHEPKIPYKETISKKGEGMFRHKKQTGGRGQFAEVHLRLHPRERGSGFEFINSIVGGAIPTNFIPAVEKGIRETMARGVLAGSNVVDLAAEVFFGKYHDVDSSEAAFKYAASMAFKEVFQQSGPILLEPIVNIEIVVPIDKMGDISGDLNTRRAHITGMNALPGGLQVVQAKVPLAEVLRYQTELKSMTGGQGSFSMEFSHLAPVPPNVQQQVVEKYKAKRTEPEEP